MATQKVYNATTKQYVEIDVTIVPDEDATLADRKKDFRLETLVPFKSKMKRSSLKIKNSKKKQLRKPPKIEY